MNWLNHSLSRRFTFFLTVVLGVLSLAFLLIFLSVYHLQMTQERAQVSKAVSLLLQASLENAMLKRDLDGLRGIVERLGQQDGITDVMILNPAGEIRFAARPELLERSAPELLRQACPECREVQPPPETVTQFVTNDQGQEVLRAFNPVKNRKPCEQCHGAMTSNPVNGVLVVDYDAGSIRGKARSGVLALVSAGVIVLFLVSLATWWFMGRFVLRPVSKLGRASSALSAGDLTVRVDIPGSDEIGRLGQVFNGMAQRLQESHETLRNREQFLQGLIDADPDGVRVIDSEYTIVMANQAYCEQVGSEMKQIVGSRCYASSHGRDEPCPPTLITCPLHEISRSGESLTCMQRFQCADSSVLQVEVSAAPLRIKLNGCTQTLFIESIRDLAKEIRYSHEQKLAGLGELAAGVAHEIHNPLASIRMALQASERAVKAGTLDEDELESYLQLVNRNIDQCIEVTGRLLRLSTLSGDRPELVEVNPAISETLSLLSHEAEQQHVRFDLDLDPNTPRILATNGDLRMVVLNLAQNAFHAMSHGGTLRVVSRVEQGEIKLSFVDSGIGIDPDALPYIFDPFFSRRADGVNGTGLGLTITRSMVKRHGGQIDVLCPGVGGTEFRLIFPNADYG